MRDHGNGLLVLKLASHNFSAYRILKPLLDILFGSDVSIDRISYSIKLLGGSIVESTTTNGQDPKASSIAYSFAHADNRVEIFSNVLSARYGFNGRQLLYVFETLNAIFKVGDGMFLTNIWVRRFADVPSCQWMEAGNNNNRNSCSVSHYLFP